MTFTVIVLDRGRPIAKHSKLEASVAQELANTYRALGWPEDKVSINPEAAPVEDRAAA